MNKPTIGAIYILQPCKLCGMQKFKQINHSGTEFQCCNCKGIRKINAMPDVKVTGLRSTIPKKRNRPN